MSSNHSIAQSLCNIRETIKNNKNIRLIAVSKYHSVEDIYEAYRCGQRIFGESRVQELLQKKESLSRISDIEWHFIGHLQRNKVKYIVPFISLIHSVDSLKLLAEINKYAEYYNRTISVLLEVKTSGDTNKKGLNQDEVWSILECLKSEKYKFPYVSIKGLMTMATNTNSNSIIIKEFEIVKNLFDNLRYNKIVNLDEFTELSMGMSRDYLYAIKSGATLVRIGTYIFGDRS